MIETKRTIYGPVRFQGERTIMKLTDGRIPAGEACPYHDKCTCRDMYCPTQDSPRPVVFNCRTAKLFDSLELIRKRPARK